VADQPSTTEELDDLFARLAGGDRSAIASTFAAIHPVVRRFCERMLRNPADADDATQLALERVFERITTYDATRHALPWILGIATWEVRTIRRRDSRTRSRSVEVEEHELPAGHADPETTAIAREALAAVDEITDSLPANDSDTLRRVLEQELATVLEPTNNATFRKRKERALGRLRSLMRNLGHVQ
jgi:RNA polymerase sigma-70 factor, ECF subfamily